MQDSRGLQPIQQKSNSTRANQLVEVTKAEAAEEKEAGTEKEIEFAAWHNCDPCHAAKNTPRPKL